MGDLHLWGAFFIEPDMLVLLPAELGVPLVSGATQLLQVTGLCVRAWGWGGDEGE